MNSTTPLALDAKLPPQLRDLLNSADGAAFEQALDAIVRQREQHLFRALGQLARDLHDAMRRLGGELAHEGVTTIVADARQHLQDVLEMSAQAANRSLDFAERMRPQARRPRQGGVVDRHAGFVATGFDAEDTHGSRGWRLRHDEGSRYHTRLARSAGRLPFQR